MTLDMDQESNLRKNMPNCFCFYMDDSGSRDPDHDTSQDNHPIDWFALGGVLIREDQKDGIKDQVMRFRCQWPQMGDAPLHSYDIRNNSRAFRWLASDQALRRRFLDDLSRLMLSLPIHVMACVIHRPGYNARYHKQYGPRRWLLCKTAFMVGVERAAKLAAFHDMKLRVFAERSDKNTDAKMREYYDFMREEGMPFDPASSAKYEPLNAAQLGHTLYEFRVKRKQSLVMQLADIALWPVCKGGYDPDNRAYRSLCDHGKLMDALCTRESGLHGIKYSCF